MLGCEEIPPDISNPGSDGTPVTGGGLDDQMRQVIIEEFTGVRCVQCPGGSQAIEDLIAIHGDRLIAVSIHSSGGFETPYAESTWDFRSQDADNLLNLLGIPLGFPTAVVNRQLFTGEDDLQLPQSAWAGRIAEELQNPPQVKIDLELDYNEANRTVAISADIHVEEEVNLDAPRITVMITENNITDLQITPESSPDPDPNYVHKHVMRDVVTNFDGEDILESLSLGSVIEKDFSYTLGNGWVAENCTVIVYVHNAGVTKEVLQAVEKYVVE